MTRTPLQTTKNPLRKHRSRSKLSPTTGLHFRPTPRPNLPPNDPNPVNAGALQAASSLRLEDLVDVDGRSSFRKSVEVCLPTGQIWHISDQLRWSIAVQPI
jgi:hypothetical protein